MSALIARQAPTAAERLADLAVQALVDEADLSPAGLVDRRGSGAHSDLHLGLMHASAQSLWPAFAAMADAARSEGRVSQALRKPSAAGPRRRSGDAARHRRVNTHRGAIWALGLLSAAAMLESGASAGGIAASAAALARLDDPAAPHNPDSHGARVCRRYGVLGAREQAQHGFPAVIEHGLPQLLASRRAGAGEQNARLDALLAIMSSLTDTCVLHRAGLEGLTRMQAGARAVLEAGGAASLAGRRQLRLLDRDMLALNASPGRRRPPGRHPFLDRLRRMRRRRLGATEHGNPVFRIRRRATRPRQGPGRRGRLGRPEVLLEPGQAGKLAIQVVTSVNGAEQRWKSLFERMFREQTPPALNIDIHDFGATPGVVRLRLEQGLEEVGHD